MTFIKYNSNLVARAKELRNKPTRAEKIFWDFLRKEFSSKHFMRQKPLEYFIKNKNRTRKIYESLSTPLSQRGAGVFSEPSALEYLAYLCYNSIVPKALTASGRHQSCAHPSQKFRDKS